MKMQRTISQARLFVNKVNLPNSDGKEEGFCAASLSLRVQKKLASRLSNRTVAKQFVSDSGARLFDSLYEVLKVHYSKKIAEKTVKNMIKLAVKLGLVARSGALSHHEEQLLRTAQMKVRSLALTIISFKKLAYSYDRAFLLELASDMRKALSQVVDLHLSDKSGKRLDHVFEHLGKQEVLDSLFRVNGPHAEHLSRITSDLEILIDAKEL